MAHHHDHGGDGHDSCGGHHTSPSDMGVHYSLYTKIDLENLQCLNEEVEGSGKLVFKPWDKRFENDKFVDSDADEELLFNIPCVAALTGPLGAKQGTL